MALDREAMAARWRAGAHAHQTEAMDLLRRLVEHRVKAEVRWLPGAGVRLEDQIALFSTFILVSAEQLAKVTSPARAAAAIRRLADVVESGRLAGAQR